MSVDVKAHHFNAVALDYGYNNNWEFQINDSYKIVVNYKLFVERDSELYVNNVRIIWNKLRVYTST